MALFNKKTIKVELEGRDQTIEMLPVPIGALNSFQTKINHFQERISKAQNSNNESDLNEAMDSIADLLSYYIVGAKKEDILDPESGLDLEDIGFLLGRLVKISQNPKA
jgi:hypothetical protein